MSDGVAHSNGIEPLRPTSPEEIRRLIEELRELAKKERIDVDGPLGAWVKAQEVIILRQAALAEWMIDKSEEHFDHASRVATLEVERLKKIVEQSRTQSVEASKILQTAKVGIASLEARTIGQLSREITGKLKDVLVIREQGWNARRNLLVAGLFAVVGIGLFFSGLAFDRYNQLLVMRDCLHQAITMPNGRAYCDVTDLRP